MSNRTSTIAQVIRARRTSHIKHAVAHAAVFIVASALVALAAMFIPAGIILNLTWGIVLVIAAVAVFTPIHWWATRPL